MKIFLLQLSLLAVISASHIMDGILFELEIPARDSLSKHYNDDNIIKGVYSTPLDHFSPTNNLSLTLNYEVNVEFFKEGGPLFFHTQSDAVDSTPWHRFGLMHSLARKLNGALIQAHHRYQGKNYLGYGPDGIKIRFEINATLTIFHEDVSIIIIYNSTEIHFFAEIYHFKGN